MSHAHVGVAKERTQMIKVYEVGELTGTNRKAYVMAEDVDQAKAYAEDAIGFASAFIYGHLGRPLHDATGLIPKVAILDANGLAQWRLAEGQERLNEAVAQFEATLQAKVQANERIDSLIQELEQLVPDPIITVQIRLPDGNEMTRHWEAAKFEIDKRNNLLIFEDAFDVEPTAVYAAGVWLEVVRGEA